MSNYFRNPESDPLFSAIRAVLEGRKEEPKKKGKKTLSGEKDIVDTQPKYTMTKGVAEELSLDELTDAQSVKRDQLITALKTKGAQFRVKYGNRAKQAMAAITTKRAVKEGVSLDMSFTEELGHFNTSDNKGQQMSTQDEIRILEQKYSRLAGTTPRIRGQRAYIATQLEALYVQNKEELSLDEVSKKTLGSYVKTASTAAQDAAVPVTARGERLLQRQRWRVDQRHVERLKKEELVSMMDNMDAEELDELSKKTLGRYVKGAARDRGMAGIEAGAERYEYGAALKKMKKRQRGIETATDKLTREELDFINNLNKL